MTSDDRLTPARAQYLRIKRRHADALLLYRMGDFYELFDDDAVTASRDLHITLTGREFGKGNRVPMAGIPHHALSSYLRRLLARGHRVAVCEQLSEAGHGLVERDVVRVLSPGTVSEPGLLPARENNYLVALCPGRGGTGLAYVDVSTGEYALAEFTVGEETALAEELARLNPAECLIPENNEPATLPGCPATHCPPRWFAVAPAEERLRRHFGVSSLEPYGCAGRPLGTAAAAALLAYIEGTNRDLLRVLRGLHAYTPDAYVALDPYTCRNLELTRTARSGERSGSLLAVLDGTRTAMGGRLLRRWLARPLREIGAINRRLDVVEALMGDTDRRADLGSSLEQAGDLERLTGRARQGSAAPRDLLALAAGLSAAATIRTLLAGDGAASPGPLGGIAARIDPAPDVSDLIGRAVCADDGRRIQRGFDADLDELTEAVGSAQRTLLEMEQRERERTGIRTLKIGYNKVFGYYIEVTRANLRAVPPDFLRKQTLANAERFVTSDLKDWEARILRAQERIEQREAEMFAAVLEQVGGQVDRLLATAAALAELDVLLAFADLAVRRRYTRPVLSHDDGIQITGGRHPVVEASLDEGAFIPNDTLLGTSEGVEPRVLLITGPNMAGKSTYLRQTALIVLLAQTGCFVPADSAHVGLVDRIFTRIGAQDDLAAGASTFLVEMVETAAILRHATSRSLLVFDEIGRGTSTFDGLAIAQAVVEDVHNRARARTLFATHFHELTALAGALPRLHNAHLTATEEDGRVVFLRRLAPGGADRSYGIHVARLAGLPEGVTARAEELLRGLEQTRQERAGAVLVERAVAAARPPYRLTGDGEGSCSACDGAPEHELAGALRSLNLAATTPMQAMNLLFEWQEALRRSACTCDEVRGRRRLTVVEPARGAWGPAAP